MANLRYIQEDDYKLKIRDKYLQQIIQQDNTILLDAEETAIAVVRDYLHSRYDMAGIFDVVYNGVQEPERLPQVVRWIMNLVMYYIHERIPDKLVPDRVVKNYDDTLDLLRDVADGKKSVDLPQLTDEDGNFKTKFRWGSQEQRTY